jgi:hypothetical protein
MALIPFVCNDCGQFVEGQTREQHRKKCKPVEAPKETKSVEPIQDPNPSGNGLEAPEKVQERVKKWKRENAERHKEYMREYMREYMKRRRQKAKQK